MAAGGWTGELSLPPTPRLEADGKGGVLEGPWPPATGPPGAAELHPFAGHRPLPSPRLPKGNSLRESRLA
uniref:Uncharacterized protein n=1 Tax=Caldilinea aerophila TaxID=133453 RepID=A0A7C1JT10_9CHLR